MARILSFTDPISHLKKDTRTQVKLDTNGCRPSILTPAPREAQYLNVECEFARKKQTVKTSVFFTAHTHLATPQKTLEGFL